jgi:hypothetical protein
MLRFRKNEITEGSVTSKKTSTQRLQKFWKSASLTRSKHTITEYYLWVCQKAISIINSYGNIEYKCSKSNHAETFSLQHFCRLNDTIRNAWQWMISDKNELNLSNSFFDSRKSWEYSYIRFPKSFSRTNSLIFTFEHDRISSFREHSR